MSDDDAPRATELLTTRQAAHALGIPIHRVKYLYLNGEMNPIYRLPGKTQTYLWTRTEVERVLALSHMQRRAFRRARRSASKNDYPMNGFQLVPPRPKRRRPPPPPTK